MGSSHGPLGFGNEARENIKIRWMRGFAAAAWCRAMEEMTSANCARAVTAASAIAKSKVCHKQPR